MSPLEQIRLGIIKMDWTIICNGYEALTGEFIHIEQEPKTNEAKVLQQIYDIVADAVEEPGYVPSTTILNQKKHTKKKIKKKVGRPKKSKKKTDIVDEDGEDSSLELDVSQITPVKAAQEKLGESQLITNIPDPDEVDKNIARAKRTTRVIRESPKKYKAKCSECSSKFESNHPTGEIGQKCPGCLKANKGRF